MAFKKFRLASSRCSAGEPTFGELGSDDWDSEESPRVKRAGLAAMLVTRCIKQETRSLREH